jgi:glycerol-3-phosphate acyltransferase PlsX
MGLQPDTFLIDIGANVDSKPEYLVHFALMGSIYMERIRGIKRPRVALLSNGSEDNKGNALTQAAFPLLKASGLNFIGNLEGLDILSGKAHVIVADAFTGNVALKYTEGLAEHLLDMAEGRLTSRLYGDALAHASEVVSELRRMSDYAETGAVPLLGVNQLILIGHGRSRAGAVKAGVLQAVKAAQVGLVDAIREGVKGIEPKN